MTELEKISFETVKFMRGKYCLDEVGDGNDELKFKHRKKTILTIYIHKDKFIFLMIFGKKERQKFESIKSEFSQYIQDYYDNSKTYHDGKWMFIDIASLEVFEEIKKLILIKKKPNRKPLPKENAIYSKCGHRCDLCIHYADMSDDFRSMIELHLNNVYGSGWSARCPGCGVQEVGKAHPCMGGDWCEELKCAAEKGLFACVECEKYPCDKATAGYKGLEPRSISADDVTWAILPYVPYQYENR